jgi:hypothetical protein
MGHRVRFDDRLLTVLNQPAGDRHDLAVRWRQLVDLVARAGSNSASAAVADALAAIRADAGNVDDPLRAAAARAVAALPLPLGLLEYFASDSLSVSAPVLAAATLEPAQWRALLARANEETRRFVETIHPEISATPPTDRTDELIEAPSGPEPDIASPATGPAGPSLSEVVARIERRRRSRAAQQSVSGAAPGIGSIGSPSLFRWECGPGGEIAWVEGAPRGPLIGRSIARSQDLDGDRIGEEVARAFAMRAPFRDASISVAGDGPVAGEWKLSGVPAFEPADGRFAGYRGIALREVPSECAAEPTVAASGLPDPDSLRELVHELKTPLNAIIGFAEIIDDQFLGPADRGYRERAGEIVAQARLLLGAIDDLDFAAKVHSVEGHAGRRADLAELIGGVGASLRELAAARGAELELPRAPHGAIAALEPELADRLLYRLCTAVIERAEARERLRLSIDQSGDQWRVSIGRPKALRGAAAAHLFDPAADGGGKANSGAAAAVLQLRLVRGLARVAGGDLGMTATAFMLRLPKG